DFNAQFAGYMPEQLGALHERILTRLKSLPGVKAVSLSGSPAMNRGRWRSPIFVAGRPIVPKQDISTLLNRVSPEYFATFEIPILQGRDISAQDSGAGSMKSVVVNQAMADYFFPNGDAIGHQFTIADPSVPGT